VTVSGGHSARRRLDSLLVAKGHFASREKARAAVLAGSVKVDGQALVKAGALVREDAVLEVVAPPRYVSRGGDKLAGALADFALDVTGRVALDSGASTGGFTDCLLQHGARHVVAVDVGYGQLAWSLRTDPRVTVVERQNLRYLTAAQLRVLLPEDLPLPDLATLDLSFIGLGKVLPAVAGILRDDGIVVALVKPQFEVGKGQVGKKGVVRRPEQHASALTGVAAAAVAAGFFVLGCTYSKLPGPEGNIEFFLLLQKAPAGHAGGGREAGRLEKTGRPALDAAGLAAAVAAAVSAAWAELEDDR